MPIAVRKALGAAKLVPRVGIEVVEVPLSKTQKGLLSVPPNANASGFIIPGLHPGPIEL